MVQYFTLSMLPSQQTISRLESEEISPQNIKARLSLYLHFIQYLALLRSPITRLTKVRRRDSSLTRTPSGNTTFCHLRKVHVFTALQN